jgi:hypothetical protein
MFLPGIELHFHDLQHIAQLVHRLQCLNSLPTPIHINLPNSLNCCRDFITLVLVFNNFHLETGMGITWNAFSRRIDSYMIVLMTVSSTDRCKLRLHGSRFEFEMKV